MLKQSEVVETLVKTVQEPIASFGNVLGNRTTLYKYTNPNLLAIVSSIPVAGDAQECILHLVDAVKGSMLYSTQVYRSEGPCTMQVVLTNNWLVYTYYELGSAVNTTKGHRLVSVEFFEGKTADDQTQSQHTSSFSFGKTDYTVYQRSYTLAHGVVAMSPTLTKFGIASKNIIVATENAQLHSLQRRLLNARRTMAKPASGEEEEGLLPFDPVVPYDPRHTISHSNSAAHIRGILASPSHLESTSLVFAYGLDLVHTRTSPSGTFDLLSEDFNRVQLLFTILALAGTISVTKPLVRAKLLRMQWYN